MLADELVSIRDLIKSLENSKMPETEIFSVGDIADFRLKIKSGWKEAFFSNSGEISLSRYYSYHLENISKLSDSFSKKQFPGNCEFAKEYQDVLLELTDYLFENYAKYLDCKTPASRKYQTRFKKKFKLKTDELILNLKAFGVNSQLHNCIINYLQNSNACETGNRLTYESLHYLEKFTDSLIFLTIVPGDKESLVNELLLDLNFNHLGYYAYRQQAYHLRVSQYSDPEKLDFFANELKSINERPEPRLWVYHQEWPSLKSMLANFLREEIHFIKGRFFPIETSYNNSTDKVPLNLSVAQLACLLRLLFDEGCFAELNLQDLFKFFARHFRTKRQEQVSSHSLSKEYYSIGQITAAVMRDKFAKMITRINQNFFPE